MIGVFILGELFRLNTKRKARRDSIYKGIKSYRQQSETKPGVSFKILFQYLIGPIPKGFNINFPNEYKFLHITDFKYFCHQSWQHAVILENKLDEAHIIPITKSAYFRSSINRLFNRFKNLFGILNTAAFEIGLTV
ncbi:MAG: hypothetical protein HKN31_12605 [Pricia sp.]|nr:hypothetical protein [Pricia sp.]